MKLLFGTQSWLNVLWILVALLSGPTVVASVWLLAAIAAETGFVVLPDGAPRFSGPKGRQADVTEIVATRDQTGGSLGLFRRTIAPKSGPPTHIHQTEDEFFYVVSGEFKVKLGNRIMSAPAQTVMFVPRGTAHTFQNVGTSPGVILVGVTPGGFEKSMEERQGVDAETLRALAKKYHLEVVGLSALRYGDDKKNAARMVSALVKLRRQELPTSGKGLGRVKTKSDLVVMPSGRQIFAFFCSQRDRIAQNSGCGYTA